MKQYIKTAHRSLIGRPRKVEIMQKNGSVLAVYVSLGEYYDEGERKFIACFRRDTLDAFENVEKVADEIRDVVNHNESIEWSDED